MTANADAEHTLITTLSQKLVEQVAPEELDLFDELLDDYFQNPNPPTPGHATPEAPLGSGLSSIMVAVTPAAAAISTATVRFIEKTLQTGQSADPASVSRELQARLGLQEKKTPLLNPAQLAELRQVTLTTATQYGMNTVQAEQLTNAILVSLVLGPSQNTTAFKPVSILFLAANPRRMDQLAIDREVRRIDAALRASARRDQFELEPHWAVHIGDLQGLLLRYQPGIVHFSGHGGKNGALTLDTDDGEPYEVPAAALSDLFRLFRNSVRCVVLNACYSAVQAEAIAEHIACVVGMSSEVDDESAISFATAFYQALGYGKDVQTAFELGRSQLKLESSRATTIPQLVSHDVSAHQLRFA